jgi:hypothetical protein
MWIRLGAKDPGTRERGRDGCGRFWEEGRTSAEENKRLVRHFYEEIDKGNLAAMDDLNRGSDRGRRQGRHPYDGLRQA